MPAVRRRVSATYNSLDPAELESHSIICPLKLPETTHTRILCGDAVKATVCRAETGGVLNLEPCGIEPCTLTIAGKMFSPSPYISQTNSMPLACEGGLFRLSSL